MLNETFSVIFKHRVFYSGEFSVTRRCSIARFARILYNYKAELNPVSTCRLIASLNLDELKKEETGQLLKDFCEPHKSLSRLMTPALKVG